MTRYFVKSRLGVLLLLLCSVSTCVYWSHLGRNWGGSANPQTGIRSDLFAQWYGTRELLLHHRDPYSDDVTREIQTAYYGQPLGPSLAADIRHQQRFAYPLYVIFLLAPTVNLHYARVEIIAWVFMAAVMALSLPLWMRSIRLSLSAWKMALLATVVFTSIPVLQALDLLQLALLVAASLAAASASVASGNLFLAGAWLALATIKPQLSLLPIAWFALWVAGGWRQRWPLAAGFVGALVFFILASALLMPAWLLRFPAALIAYARQTHAKSLLDALLPVAAARLSTIILILVGVQFWWRARRYPADSPLFALALAFSLTLTTLVVPVTFQPFNYVVLLPTLLLVIQRWGYLRGGSPLWRLCVYSCCVLGLLAWPLALALTAGRIIPLLSPVRNGWYMPINGVLAMPFAALGFLLLLIGRTATNSRRSAVAATEAARPQSVAENIGR